MRKMFVDMSEVDRLEVIGMEGRLLVLHPCSIKDISIQDKGKTMKIFVEKQEEG